MLLLLVDVKYRFFYVEVGISGSSSDAKIFKNKLKEKIENGTLEPSTPGA